MLLDCREYCDYVIVTCNFVTFVNSERCYTACCALTECEVLRGVMLHCITTLNCHQM